MPPQLLRYPNGPTNVAPYQHQFAGLNPGHSNNYTPQLGGNPSHLNPNAQIPSFATNGNVLGLGGGMNSAAASFGVGHDSGLGGQAARMGFQNATLQHPQHAQQHSHSMMGDQPARNPLAKGRIREVWKHNLEDEMAVLRDLVQDYPYIAMDTEFPGVVARPMGAFRGKSDYHYQCLRVNVDLLKVIQIGISLFNEDGETPATRPNSTNSTEVGGAGRKNANQNAVPHAWQFNFNFSLNDDMYNEQSIDSLKHAGIDFGLLERDGIDPKKFAALLIPSGLTHFEEVKWISFHGGYDFGYLTKLLMCEQMPNDELEFTKRLKIYFPSVYDVKHLMKHAIKQHNSGLLTPSDPSTTELLQKFEQKSGLESIAEALKIKRLGAAHQAGSDGLLTGRVFFSMREKVFNGDIPTEQVGKIWGLGVPDIGPPAQQQSAADNTPPQQGQGNNAQGTPSTPNQGNAGLVNTPAGQAQNANGVGNMGPMTPGGGGGIFGQFNIGAR
ncbi:hypothetical protein KVR01_004241 [Diaporthe batatas]|uniref:uncharacterized protein n=1 Tax=Diaporthe batatas TaxID=748121 RepID=UPI001D0481F2|nr:uncharacterized protein KVR01_004241 [Diaporthe batatas]KAG8165689.1 hypothetical protein KVR01_004241 [Diaporthe batatas]